MASDLKVMQDLCAFYYGKEHQLAKLQEELGELSAAIARLQQANEQALDYGFFVDEMFSELADVKNVMSQVVSLYSAEAIVKYKQRNKMRRQLDRITKELSTASVASQADEEDDGDELLP